MEKNDNLQQDEQEQLEATLARIPVGEQLRQKREQLGITQDQVADKLCLKVSVIEKMETQSFEDGDLTIFIRGYFRSYAKMLNMDENKLLADLEDEQLPPPSVQKMTSFSRKQQQKKHESRVMLVTWVIGFIVVAIFAYWWWQNKMSTSNGVESSVVETQQTSVNENGVDFAPQDPAQLEYSTDTENGIIYSPSPENDDVVINDTAGANNTSTSQNSVSPTTDADNNSAANEDTESNTSASDVSESNVSESNTQASQQTDNSASANSGDDANSTMSDIESLAPPQLDVSNVTETAAEPAEVEDNHLKITFSDKSWIQIIDGNNVKLVEKIMNPGQTLEYTNTPPYRLKIGTVKGITITYGGEAIDLSGYAEGRLVRLTLPAAN